MEQTMWADHIHGKDTNFGGSIQVAGFYGQSTNGKGLGKYFTFDNKEVLKVSTGPDRDIHSFNFNLRTAYDGTMSFKPEHESWGLRMDYHQDLDDLLPGLYFQISAPIVHVAQDMNLTEKATATGGDHIGPQTIKQAFAGHQLTTDQGERWRYGKINGRQTATGIADVDVKIGYNILDEKNYDAGIELAAIIPTGNKRTGEYVFEPMVGNGRHWGIGAGAHGSYNVWNDGKNKENNLAIEAHVNYRYLFSNPETRTLELKGKKWARYMRMRQVDPSTPANVLPNSVPGINVLTRNVDVTPGSSVEAVASLNYTHSRWNICAGYNLWWKERESVKGRGKWDANGQFGLAGASTFRRGLSNTTLVVRDTAAHAARTASLLQGVFGLLPQENDGGRAQNIGNVLRDATIAAGMPEDAGAPAADKSPTAVQVGAAADGAGVVALYDGGAVAQAADAVAKNADPAATSNAAFAGLLPPGNAGRNAIAATIENRLTNPGRSQAFVTDGMAASADAARDAVLAVDAELALAAAQSLPNALAGNTILATVNSAQTIAGIGGADGKLITEKDVDWERAANPSALSHKVFASVGYELDFDHPAYVAVGGSYEFGEDRKALEQWQVWAKFGVSF